MGVFEIEGAKGAPVGGYERGDLRGGEGGVFHFHDVQAGEGEGGEGEMVGFGTGGLRAGSKEVWFCGQGEGAGSFGAEPAESEFADAGGEELEVGVEEF